MKKLIIGFIILSLGALGVYGVYWIIDPAPVKTAAGIIRYIDAYQLDRDTGIWGLEAKRTFLGIPIGTRKFSFQGVPFDKLPDEFKKEGLKVRVRFKIVDVIGMSDWDVWIQPVEIEKITE